MWALFWYNVRLRYQQWRERRAIDNLMIEIEQKWRV